LIAFWLAIALPVLVVGPVDLSALFRLALILASEVIVILPSSFLLNLSLHFYNNHSFGA
jgi:hypothetical protein